MKYRLKKDLPFDNANSGGVIWRKEDGKCYTMDSEGRSCCMGYASNLVNSGWIEEVKPREFEIQLTKDGLFQSFMHNGYVYVVPYHITSFNPKEIETIKVREVIE